jgi:hypothetical protein
VRVKIRLHVFRSSGRRGFIDLRFATLLIICLIFLSRPATAVAQVQNAGNIPSTSDETPPKPKKAEKVWTNENLREAGGAVSVVGNGSNGKSNGGVTHQHSRDGITIVSPSEGTVVSPGETVSVNVEVTGDQKPESMSIVGRFGFGSPIRFGPPFSFSLEIPKQDGGGAGTPLIGFSEIFVAVPNNPSELAVTIDIEVPELPNKLSALLPAIIFESVGEASPPIILADFPTAGTFEVTRSSRISISSSNTNVVTVDPNGQLIARGRGQAEALVTYEYNGQEAKLAIPVQCICQSSPGRGNP